MSRERVAVVGAGVAGLTAAFVLRHRYDVTLFEADDRLGGHAHTHDLVTPDGSAVAVDTGFLVHNSTTYPTLVRLFGTLGVQTRETEMSMSVRCRGCGLAYAGGRRATGLLPRGRATLSPYTRMLLEVPRFYRAARSFPSSPDDHLTLGAFLAAEGFSRYFANHFALPLVSAVWSSGEGHSLDYPAAYLFAFLRNHGMLSPTGTLPWRTVVGGSRTYVDRIGAAVGRVATSTPIRSLRRHTDGVDLADADGTTHPFDRVVVATHADEALGLLVDPSAEEKEVLGAFSYSHNEAWLHEDATLLPDNPSTRASWNYIKLACDGRQPVLVSYHLNRLMRLSEPVDYVLTLNGQGHVDSSKLIKSMSYRHPVYTAEAVAAQSRLPNLNGPRIAFAGAYHGWGFHEDGCASGVRAASALGVLW